MDNYSPIKLYPSRITANYKPFKEIRDSIITNTYSAKNAKSTGIFSNVTTTRANSLKTDTPIAYLLTKLFHDKFSKYFPKQDNCGKIILRCFESTMHRDTSWKNNLFLSVVLKASSSGHMVLAFPANVSEKDNSKASQLVLRSGDVFLLDPCSIHSVHSMSVSKQELVLLQYELEFKTRERALEVLNKCKFLTI